MLDLLYLCLLPFHLHLKMLAGRNDGLYRKHPITIVSLKDKKPSNFNI